MSFTKSEPYKLPLQKFYFQGNLWNFTGNMKIFNAPEVLEKRSITYTLTNKDLSVQDLYRFIYIKIFINDDFLLLPPLCKIL